jgi:hypothetical protein
MDALPKTRDELYNFLLVILAAITLLTTCIVNKRENPSNAEIEIIIEQSVQIAIQQSQIQSQQNEKLTIKKISYKQSRTK